MIVVCTACSSVQSPPGAGVIRDPTSPPLASPLTSPLANPIPIVRVTQDAKLGRLTGKLLLKTTSGDTPVVGRILYLAVLSKDASGKETGAGFSRTDSPRTYSDVDGSFIFANVPVGRYALIMDMVTASYMLKKPADKTDMIADIQVGKTTDLGALVYDDLPK